MSSIEVMVIIGGISAIAWINWYFFMAQAVAGKQVFQSPEKKKSSTGKTEGISPLVETDHH